MALDEVVTVQPAVVTDQLEDAVARGGEAAASQLGVVLGGRLDWSERLLLPDFGRPVSHGEEQVTLFPVLRNGVDGAVVTVSFLAQDHVGLEFLAHRSSLVGGSSGLLQRHHLSLFGSDDVLQGVI